MSLHFSVPLKKFMGYKYDRGVHNFSLLYFRDADWFQQFYIASYTRASPYIYGILFGYFMHTFSQFNRTTGKKLPKVRNITQCNTC
jgi:hypothetical protein